MSELRPSAGARFRLALDSATEHAASYRCTIATPDAEWTTTARLSEDGVELAPCDAPEALVAALAMFAKLTARGAAQRRAEGMPVWPARVQRWRASK